MTTSFRLTAGPLADPALRVASFEARHAMNDLYEASVQVWGSAVEADELETILLAKAAALHMEVPGESPRVLHGTIVGVTMTGRFDKGRVGARLAIAPRAYLLQKRVQSRIFQDLTVREIVTRVLAAAEITHEWRLSSAYPRRQYCLQYQESDWAFVTRLLAEEGIVFWFEHPDLASSLAISGERMILADSPSSHPPIPGDPRLAYRPETGGLETLEGAITRIERSSRVEPTAVRLSDYDFRRPLLDLTTRREGAEPGSPGVDLVVYDHHGEYEETDVDVADAGGNARTYLEQLRASALVLRGESACRRLLPGHRFELDEHELERLNGGYTLISTEERGATADSEEGARQREYDCRLACVPASVLFRPRRPPRRIQQVTETAMVVGPVGQEIHVDEVGRVKVQFPWDRDGKRDEHSSCWIRVLQPWGGEGWGFQFFPRIGMEVLVGFLGGDVDRPVVLGSLYNATHPVPYALPTAKTRSALRTKTTPGGGGANEIAFEDAAGREEIFVRATLDQNEEVGRDLRTTVARHHTDRIGGDETSTTGGKREDTTGADHVDTVHGHRISRIGGSDQTTIGGDRVLETKGRSEAQIGGAQLETVGGARRTFAGGTSSDTVAGDRFEATTGVDRRSSQGDMALVTAGRLSLEAGGGISFAAGTPKEPAVVELRLSGDIHVAAGGAMSLSLKDAIRLEIGDSTLEIGPDKVHIRSKKILIEADEMLASTGDAKLALGEDVEVRAKGIKLASKDDAILELASEAKLDGSAIKLGSKNAAEAIEVEKREEQKKEVGTVDVHLFDLQGQIIDGAPYEASCFGWIDAGEAAGGVVKVPDFPDVDRVHVKWSRPGAADGAWEFEKDVYLHVDTGSDDETARRKLHNLGFEEESALRAVQRYQEASGASVTGRADPGDLEDRHGGVKPVAKEDRK